MMSFKVQGEASADEKTKPRGCKLSDMCGLLLRAVQIHFFSTFLIKRTHEESVR